MKPITTYCSSGFLPKGLFSTVKKHNKSMTTKVAAVPEEAQLTSP